MTDGQIVGARGRPLRFLALVTTGWVGLRTAMLWPQLDSATAVLHAICACRACRSASPVADSAHAARDRTVGTRMAPRHSAYA